MSRGAKIGLESSFSFWLLEQEVSWANASAWCAGEPSAAAPGDRSAVEWPEVEDELVSTRLVINDWD